MKNTAMIILFILFGFCVIYLTPNKQKEPVTLGYHEAPQWMKDEAHETKNNRISLVRIQESQGIKNQD